MVHVVSWCFQGGGGGGGEAAQALQAALQGLGLPVPVLGQQQPAAEQEGSYHLTLKMTVVMRLSQLYDTTSSSCVNS